MTVDLNSLVFLKITDEADVVPFFCSQYRDLENFLKDDAKNYQRERIATTDLVYSDGTLVGFFSLAMGYVGSNEVMGRIGEIIYTPKRFPALLLARMAVHDGIRGQGIGQEMLSRVFSVAVNVCPHVGCRFVVVDAKKDPRTINFYEKYGHFEKIHESDETVKMIVDMNVLTGEDRTTGTTLSDFR